jgi:hypothetical protein
MVFKSLTTQIPQKKLSEPLITQIPQITLMKAKMMVQLWFLSVLSFLSAVISGSDRHHFNP